MAHTYSQLNVQIVFAVKNRKGLILPEWKETLYRYIWGICKNKDIKLLAVGGIYDHIHILIQFKPNVLLSDFIDKLKTSTSKWINKTFYGNAHAFAWQNGFGIFSYGSASIDNVIHYIKAQEEHHKTETFLAEYQRMITPSNGNFFKEDMFDALE